MIRIWGGIWKRDEENMVDVEEKRGVGGGFWEEMGRGKVGGIVKKIKIS